MLTNHLVIFVRAPVAGAVKRRLAWGPDGAGGIGAAAACRFYRRNTATVIQRIAHDKRWRTWLAVSPDRTLRAARVWPRRVARLPQGRGDLGRRMAQPLAALPPGPVAIVGTDIPDLAKPHIAAAFAALCSHNAVFGPAPDGGYWLAGFRRRPALLDPFAGVRWSSEHALDDTLANLPRTARVAFLETLRDIDTPADYAAWRCRAQFANASAARANPGAGPRPF